MASGILLGGQPCAQADARRPVHVDRSGSPPRPRSGSASKRKKKKGGGIPAAQHRSPPVTLMSKRHPAGLMQADRIPGVRRHAPRPRAASPVRLVPIVSMLTATLLRLSGPISGNAVFHQPPEPARGRWCQSDVQPWPPGRPTISRELRMEGWLATQQGDLSHLVWPEAHFLPRKASRLIRSLRGEKRSDGRKQ